MKTHTRHAFASAVTISALVLLINVPGSFAQSIQLRADVPFDFYISGKLMPAGSYTVRAVNAAAIRVSDANGNATVVGTTASFNDKLQKPRLIFHRYGNVNFLSELYWENYGTGRALQKSARELEASNDLKSQTIQLATSGKR